MPQAAINSAIGHQPPKRAKHRTTSIAKAKSGLSELIQEVERSRTEVTILRRGIPAAKLVPVEAPSVVSGYGWMRGSVEILGDIVGPSGEEWDVEGEG